MNHRKLIALSLLSLCFIAIAGCGSSSSTVAPSTAKTPQPSAEPAAGTDST
jgi:hypothetical protein